MGQKESQGQIGKQQADNQLSGQLNLKIPALLLFGVFLIAVPLFWYFMSPHDYVIPGVPFATVYNHIDNDVEHFTQGIAAGAYSVLRYYGEELNEEDLEFIQNTFYEPTDDSILYSLRGLETIASEFGYEYEWLNLSFKELKKYINEEQQNPLIFAHNLIIDQPERIDFSVVGVLIGVLESEKSVVAHDFYYGHSKKISFDVFSNLNRNLRNAINVNSGDPEYIGRYFLLKPKDREYLSRTNSPYPQRSESMELAEPLIDKIALSIAIGRGEAFDGYQEVQFSYLKEVISDPNFEAHVPPYWKTIAYSTASVAYAVLEGDLKTAEQLAAKAEQLNGSIDEPWSDFWPGFAAKVYLVEGEIDGPYYARGVLQGFAGEYEASIESFNKALGVYPYADYAKRGIGRSELRIQERENI